MRQAVRTVLGAREYQHLLPVAAFHQMREQRALAILRHRMHPLRHQFRFRIAPRDFDQNGIVQNAIRQFANIIGKRRGEEQILPLLRQQREDAFYIVNKTHVEHAVGFIQYQNFHL